uniref:Uncharacterized protein n=1 Tax=Hemiselmis andersenii TaxID=464988 RepID=A0A7S1EFN0_HEMAN
MGKILSQMAKWSENIELLVGVMMTTCLALLLLSMSAYNYPSWYGGKEKHVHSLIPAGLGMLIGLSSFGVRVEKARKAAAHIAVLCGMAGIGGAVPGLMKLPKILAGDKTVAKPDAARIQAVMFVVCVPFVVFSVAWFVSNRRAQKAKEAGKGK